MDAILTLLLATMLFAIVDIETAGGNATNSAITEIAIVITDGKNIIETYESLVDPQMHIPSFITNLTGITNQMVEDAPTFEYIAEEVHSILQDKIFVAHNVNFDYSFVSKQLQDAGFPFQAKKICTVRYSRKIVPGQRSYALGNITSYFGISNKSAHRAMGDTHATTLLFHELLQLDTENYWETYLAGNSKDVNLPSNLESKIFFNLPEKTGVYYFKDSVGKIIYIGKAKNIKSRVAQHFSGKKGSKKDQEFHREIANITFYLTGNEFLALLYEDSEIRKYWPRNNKAQKTSPTKFHIGYYKDQNDDWRLGVIKGKYIGQKLHTTYSWLSAREIMMEVVKQHQLKPELCQIKLPDNEEVTDEIHNSNFELMIESQVANPIDFVIWEDGRTQDEFSFVLVKDSQFFGFGFIPRVKQTTDVSVLESLLVDIVPSGVTAKYISNYLFSGEDLSLSKVTFSTPNLLF